MSNSMEYKQRTSKLGIPVPGYGDKILPEMELKRFQLLENMLLAAMRGNVNSVFEEGSFTVTKGEDGSYKVLLSATGLSACATGNVGGAYFDAPSSVSWEGLKDGFSYFLYIRGSFKTFLEPSDVRTVSSLRRLTDSVSVLMAKVDLTGSVAVLDRMPDGKVNARDVAKHVEDWDNPHGSRVVQDEILVKKILALEADAEICFGEEKMPVATMVAALAAMGRTSRKVLDFLSAGRDGIVLDGGGKVSFVSVSRVATGEMGGAKTGEVEVGYFGTDSKVSRPDLFVVRNDGDAGVKMRALVICG